jgi:hypothetical protein
MLVSEVMDLQEVGYGCTNWMKLAQDRDRWQAFVTGNEPSASIKCGEFLDWLKTG